jgi:galactose oxidase-like protein
MTAHTPNPTANSMMSAVTGAAANKKMMLLDSASYPGFSNLLNDTYVFTGTDWSAQSTSAVDANGPLPTRSNATMCWDGNNVVLYGGAGSSSSTGTLADVWVWNTTSQTWSQKGGLGFSMVVPYGRYNAEGAFLNGASPGMLMFGGQNNNSLIEESWLWTSTSTSGTWSQISVGNGVGPSARIGHNLVGNTPGGSTAGTAICFAGQGTNQLYNDLWSYTTLAGWTQITTTNTGPSVRSNGACAYDTSGSRWVFFSGENAYGYLTDTWTLNSAATTWTQISSGNGVGPAGRIGAQMAYDSQSGFVTLFGGITATAGYAASDTWQLQGSTWVQI